MTSAVRAGRCSPPSLSGVIRDIDAAWQQKGDGALLVGLSGIDGSGKGFLGALMAKELRGGGRRVALLNVDQWLEPPSRRFNPDRPSEHFYEHGLRLDEMFDRLILPLKACRSVTVEFDTSDSSNAERVWRERIDLHEIEVAILEGIFIYKRAYQDHFDRRLWVDCTFETALERALARGQEMLPDEAVIRDYSTIYFPAQRLHTEVDDPRSRAHTVIVNDPRLEDKLA